MQPWYLMEYLMNGTTPAGGEEPQVFWRINPSLDFCQADWVGWASEYSLDGSCARRYDGRSSVTVSVFTGFTGAYASEKCLYRPLLYRHIDRFF